MTQFQSVCGVAFLIFVVIAAMYMILDERRKRKLSRWFKDNEDSIGDLKRHLESLLGISQSSLAAMQDLLDLEPTSVTLYGKVGYHEYVDDAARAARRLRKQLAMVRGIVEVMPDASDRVVPYPIVLDNISAPGYLLIPLDLLKQLPESYQNRLNRCLADANSYFALVPHTDYRINAFEPSTKKFMKDPLLDFRFPFADEPATR